MSFKLSDKLLIMGGIERENGFELGPGKYYGKATLLLLDLHSASFKEILSIKNGNENYPDEYPNLEFTSGAVEKDQLWMVTDTEVRLYQYPEIELLKLFSHPCFHNNHSIAVHGDHLYVTSTGLDMVVVLDKFNGKIVKRINAEGKDIWHRFSSDMDYRKTHSTRPHDCHPNYVFWLDNEAWVTRCTQEDAVCLSDTSKRIDISGSVKEISVHDGIVQGNYVYFTSVDGCIVKADTKTYNVVETMDLYKCQGYQAKRGWCRGLYVENNLFYIGFSRLRKTLATGKLAWLKKLSNIGAVERTSSVLVVDITANKIVKEFSIPEGMIDAIYTILPEPKVMN